MRRRLVGRVRVPLAPGDAFRLFTASGEREWVTGWDPEFAAPTDDDTDPGTIFETEAHGRRTTWVVTESVAGERIAYARVVPADHAGTITVVLRAVGDASEVRVTYDLTALTPAGADRLDHFADGYAEFLRSWEDAISSHLIAARTPEAAR
jgi:hypothetical protein